VSPGAPPAAEDWARTRETHAGLSAVDVQFREHAFSDPELLGGVGANRPEEQPLLRFPRQPWPLFISRRRSSELANAAIAVSQLFRSIPERIFGNDIARMAAFYRRDPDLLRTVLSPPNGIAEGLSRGDFIASESGYKCAEFNFGGNLGGIDNGILARMTLGTPAMRRFLATLDAPVRHRDTCHLLTRYIIRQVLSARLSGGEVNAAFLLSGSFTAYASLAQAIAREHAAVIDAIGPPVRGQLFFCGPEELTARAGLLYHHGTRVHAVIEGDDLRLDAAILRCFKGGALRLFNRPVSRLLSDKRNLALISESAESDAFTAEERGVIDRHIPRTRFLVPGVEREVLARRQELVLKKAWSMGGSDVVIGRETPPAEWEHAVHTALGQGDWIAQEHVESLSYLFQHGEGCCVHKAVWGPYVFGNEYAGMFMRVQPEERGRIVNASRGAYIANLVEVDDPTEEQSGAG
jgi:hypothetical protein